jgi:hypothetical protein
MRTLWSKILLIVLLVLIVGPLESDLQIKAQAEFESDSVRADTLQAEELIQLPTELTASLDGSDFRYENQTTFLSEILKPKFEFDGVGVEWEEIEPPQTNVEFQVRFEYMRGEWGPWNVLHPDEPGSIEEFVSTKRSKSIQYKVLLQSNDASVTPQVKNVNFHYIDGSYKKGGQSPNSELKKLTFGNDELNIISREEWGADESWRTNDFFGYVPDENIEEVETETEDMSPDDEPTIQELYPEEFELEDIIYEDEDGNDLYWPLSYATDVNKIIVHHTAGTNGLENAEGSIRGIYYYHTVRKGWGDIGYNYLIDIHGNIYEGRAGGDSVVAGHARGNNTGSLGIAVMGNYEEENISYEALKSLVSLVQSKAELHNINADGFSRFRGEVTPNIGGHRDFGQTLCPGKNLYSMLPAVRDIADSNISNTETSLLEEGIDDPYAFANSNSYDALMMTPETSETFTLEIKNIGTETWGNETYLVANRNSNAEALVHLVKSDENSSSVAYMNESSVESGDYATFDITAEAMMRGGFESFDVTPIFNGTKKTSHYLNLPVFVANPLLTYNLSDLSQSQDRIEQSEEITGKITIKNTGNVTWYRDGLYPMTLSGLELPEEVVEPGEFATFDYSFTVSGTPGVHTEYFTPQIEGGDPFEGGSIGVSVLVYDSSTQAQFYDAETDDIFEPGEKKDGWLDLTNIGIETWRKTGNNAFSVGLIHHPDIRVTTPTLRATTDPGEVGRLQFTITAPETPGAYKIYLRPRLGKQNLVQTPFYYTFTVKEEVVESVTATTALTTTSDLDQEEIRVKLNFEGDPVLTAGGAFDVYRGNTLFMDLDAGDEVKVSLRGDSYQIEYDAYAWVVDEIPRFVPRSTSTIMQIINHENRPAWNTSLNDNLYRGILEIREDSGQLVVINELPMEMYLRGLAEATNSEPTEKIRTMSILARTYARWYMEFEEKFPGKPYHLDDNPDVSQKYLGYGLESRAPNVVQATSDTAGMVVTYDGDIIKTPYFSSTDGTSTRSGEEVWGWTHTPYLQSVSDTLCEVGYFSGHGVGLSGCGATAAAENGSSYEEIIKYYYQGVEIEVK